MAPLNELHTLARRGSPFHEGVTSLVIVQLLMPSIAILLVANRIYFRLRLARNLAWDDYAIIAAIVSVIYLAPFSPRAWYGAVYLLYDTI